MMEIVLKLLRMVFEVGRDDQHHLSKRDLAVCRRAHAKFRFEKRFKVHDCRYRTEANGGLF